MYQLVHIVMQDKVRLNTQVQALVEILTEFGNQFGDESGDLLVFEHETRSCSTIIYSIINIETLGPEQYKIYWKCIVNCVTA